MLAASAGTPIEPVAMMTPWPCIRRGTLICVPNPPGFVSVQVVPWKSSAPSFPSRPRRTRSSKAARNPRKSSWQARLTFGTSRARPPGIATSMATPRWTYCDVSFSPWPSRSRYDACSARSSRSARTSANATRCVNDALPSARTAMCAFNSRRFSTSALTGSVRTVVAVGRARLWSMFFAMLRAKPRSGSTSTSGSATGSAAAGGGVGSAAGFARGATRSKYAAHDASIASGSRCHSSNRPST